MTGLRPADDATLFVLDDEGVFLSESRQELHTFNTAATFVWCAVEIGMTREELVDAYRAAFDLPAHTAASYVAELLHRWRGLGYVEGDVGVPAPSIDVATALGRLLTNDRLRAAFAVSPAATVADLGGRDDDARLLAALDPAALEAQAQLLRAMRAAGRRNAGGGADREVIATPGARGHTAFERAARARLRTLGAPPRDRDYRLLDTTIRVRFAGLADESVVHPSMAHLECRSDRAPDVVLHILEDDGLLFLVEVGVPVAHCAGYERLVPLVKLALRRIALGRAQCFMELHAAVVCDGSRCIVFPAASGRGKTTLAAALARSGFTLFSDEFALLGAETLDVRPVPMAMAVKSGAMSALAPYYPELERLPTHLREDGQNVRYLPPAPVPTELAGGRPVRWIVFPSYDPAGRTELRPVPRPDALRRLLAECLVLPDSLDSERVRRLVAWLRTTECFELTVRSVDEAVACIAGRWNAP